MASDSGSSVQSSSSAPWPCSSSGVDWITATAPMTGSGPRLLSIGSSLLDSERRSGQEEKPCQLRDYRGWRAGQTLVAVRDVDAIVQLSGQRARESWKSIAAVAANVSRLDIQATGVSPSGAVPLASLCDSALYAARSRPGRPVSHTLIRNSDGGSTLYCGQRISDRFGRLYDKGVEAETHPPGIVWRWEVEFKRSLARRAVDRLLRAEEQGMTARGLVWAHFAGLGIPPTFDSVGSEVLSPDRSSTDDERRLIYLGKMVRPMVERLIGRGMRDEVVAALGLAPPKDAVRTGMAGMPTSN